MVVFSWVEFKKEVFEHIYKETFLPSYLCHAYIVSENNILMFSTMFRQSVHVCPSDIPLHNKNEYYSKTSLKPSNELLPIWIDPRPHFRIFYLSILLLKEERSNEYFSSDENTIPSTTPQFRNLLVLLCAVGVRHAIKTSWTWVTPPFKESENEFLILL